MPTLLTAWYALAAVCMMTIEWVVCRGGNAVDRQGFSVLHPKYFKSVVLEAPTCGGSGEDRRKDGHHK